jgi:hypothetical protein
MMYENHNPSPAQQPAATDQLSPATDATEDEVKP